MRGFRCWNGAVCRVAGGLLALNTLACGEGTTEPGFPAIETTLAAEYAAKDIFSAARAVRLGLANGSFSSQSVSGNSGTAAVTGTVNYQSGISCGSSCVRSQNATTITIVFNQFVVNTASNTTTTLTGTVVFTDNTWSQQSGLSYSSGGTSCIVAQSTITYRYVGTDAAGQFGASDTITALDSCGDQFSQSGDLSTASRTFSF
jgi:hypothetical protein